MTVIRTKTNIVVAHEPEPSDRYIQIVWHGPPEEGSRYSRALTGPLWPLDEYQACVDWAVSMADYMNAPIYIEPLRLKDVPKELRP